MRAIWSSTDRGDWHGRTVVIATGACNIPCVPQRRRGRAAGDPHAHADRSTATPISSSTGGVLVVGASATGIQLADEIHRSGRPVTLAVGEHIRAPRTYRGRDIQWWMDAAGVLDQRYDEVDDIARARKVPSLQLVGTPERTMLDLNALRDIGVQAGRPARRHRRRQAAVLGLARQPVRAVRPQAGPAARHDRPLGDRATASTPRSMPPHRFAPTRVARRAAARPGSRPRRRSGRSSGRPASAPTTRWLEVPVLDRKGQIRHDGGVVAVARPVPDGHAVPAPPQVRADRRRRRRRPRSQRRISPRTCAAGGATPERRPGPYARLRTCAKAVLRAALLAAVSRIAVSSIQLSCRLAKAGGLP